MCVLLWESLNVKSSICLYNTFVIMKPKVLLIIIRASWNNGIFFLLMATQLQATSKSCLSFQLWHDRTYLLHKFFHYHETKLCFPCICIKVHHLKLIKHNRNVKCTFAYEWWCFVCILRRTHWTWVLRGTSPGNFEYRTHHFFLLVTFINHTVCTFFFFLKQFI